MTEDHKLEILKMYFESLRAEILEKIKLSHQLGYYKLISLGALLGFSVSNQNSKPEYEIVTILAVAILPLSFDLALYFNGKAIISVGGYIRRHLEPALKNLVGNDPSIMLWEEYISPAREVATVKQRLWWNLFESVQSIITMITQAWCVYIFLYRNQYIPMLITLVALSMASVLLMLGVTRTST